MPYVKISIAGEKRFYLNKRFYIYLLKIKMYCYGTYRRAFITTTTTTTTTKITTVTTTGYLFSFAR